MTSLKKVYSLQSKPKTMSQNKLPKLATNMIIDTNNKSNNKNNKENNQFGLLPKNLTSKTPNSSLLYLNKKSGSSINDIKSNKTVKTLTQQNQAQQIKKQNNKSVIKLKPLDKQDILKDLKSQKQLKQKIMIETTGITDSKTDSARSSRTLLHPVVDQIQALISQQTKNVILPVKTYNQNSLGQVSSIWWCVIDSLFISLPKIIKIKPIQNPVQTKQGTSIQKNKSTKFRQSPTKDNERSRKQSFDKQPKKIYGIIESNTKASIQMSRVYCYLEQQNKKNQQTILKYYEDPNHLALILQALFYQKSIVYLLGSIRKWNHHQQHLYIHSLAIQLIPCIIECRKLIIDILMQAVQNQQQDNKIRKPKYIARQKKLIQISKFISMMRSEYQKYIVGLGSPHRYKIFNIPQNLRDHSTLLTLQQKWRNIAFDVPIPPFILQKQNKKQFLLVIQPLNLLYKYNKKQQSLQIDPYAQLFLKNLSFNFDIILFTNTDKQSSLLNFLGVLDKAEILAVLDKHYMTHLAAKPIKDITKIGAGFANNKILVIDDKLNAKFYHGCKESLLLVQGSHAQTKIARINGKLVRMDEHDDDYLKNLSSKIINCAEKGGHWSQIIQQKHQRRK